VRLRRSEEDAKSEERRGREVDAKKGSGGGLLYVSSDNSSNNFSNNFSNKSSNNSSNNSLPQPNYACLCP